MSQSAHGQTAAMQRLAVLAPIVFAWVCAEAAVSILANWPYQFTGQGDPDQMLLDFVVFGTLLAPPLPLLLLFGATAFLAGRSGRRGEIANAAMVLICMVMAIGSLGEALSSASSDVPRAVQHAGGTIGTIVFASLSIMALKALVDRRAMAQSR
jgi:hypothetical protein